VRAAFSPILVHIIFRLIAFIASTHAPAGFSLLLVHIIFQIDCIHCIQD